MAIRLGFAGGRPSDACMHTWPFFPLSVFAHVACAIMLSCGLCVVGKLGS